ncbi:MAG: hypothetical protein H6834_09575 [Planctomycetes bacterium]|nr:hypothetical protein [Planctomycetota bacterium]
MDRRLQGALLFSFLLQLGVFTCTVIIALVAPSVITVAQGGASSREIESAARTLLAIDATLWPAIALSFQLVALIAIRTSHRIAGPLLRFRCVFTTLLEHRDPGTVRLRRGDHLQREAEMLDRLARQVVRDRERLDVLQRDVTRLLQECEEGNHVSEEVLAIAERHRCPVERDEAVQS